MDEKFRIAHMPFSDILLVKSWEWWLLNDLLEVNFCIKQISSQLALELDSPHVFLSCGEDAMVFSIDLREEKPTRWEVDMFSTNSVLIGPVISRLISVH